MCKIGGTSRKLRILVCGDRNWTDYFLIATTLYKAIKHEPRVTIIHGAARGADSMAGIFARTNGLNVRSYPAQWSKHGKAAGIIRNQQMLDEGKPDKVIAFHDDIKNSKGTKDMIERAKKAGIPVELVTH